MIGGFNINQTNIDGNLEFVTTDTSTDTNTNAAEALLTSFVTSLLEKEILKGLVASKG